MCFLHNGPVGAAGFFVDRSRSPAGGGDEEAVVYLRPGESPGARARPAGATGGGGEGWSSWARIKVISRSALDSPEEIYLKEH